MKQLFTDLKLPIFLLILICLAGALFMPIMPVDETRYVSVAWEMWNRHSFLVPYLNGAPYSHKPPVLFWLIQAGWKLFGVNDITPRLTPGLFSLLNLLLVYRIGRRLWPEERKAARCTALILISTLIWSVWSFAIMFDMILTFWILLGLLGTLRASAKQRDGWLMLIAGVAGGLLTKGPAVLVYLLSVPLFRAWWDRQRETPVRATWYLTVLGAAAAGFAIALLWAVPAAIQGGEVYGNDILWGQTVGRVAIHAAHHRPFWWYLPILPLFFFPWFLFRPVYSKINFNESDTGTRFCLSWLGLPLLIFSLIGGKQIHYLIPFIPAGALLMGRNLARIKGSAKKINTRILGGLFLLIGLIAPFTPAFSKHSGGDMGPLDAGDMTFIAAGLLVCGVLFLLPWRKQGQSVQRVAATLILFLFCALFHNKQTFLDNYDIKGTALFIHARLDEGYCIAHIGKYAGQYQFLGRLTEPLPVIGDGESDRDQFVKTNPKALFISYQHAWEPTLPAGATVLYSHECRGKDLLIWKLP